MKGPTSRSTRAADRADFEINVTWPPPGYLGRSATGAAAAEDAVEHSIFLAKMLGVILVVGPVVKVVRHKQFAEACERAYGSPTAVFVIGGLLFIVSTAFVLSHSVWVADWQVVVTLIGWLMLSISLLQLFVPRSMAWPMTVLPRARYRLAVDAAQLLLGVYLMYWGFMA